MTRRFTTADLEALTEGATRGPWKWDDYQVPNLTGRGGSPDTYEYEADVLEADHNGECGCRSACTLELNVNDNDKALIAAAPGLAAELHRIRRELEERIRVWQKVADRLEASGDTDVAEVMRHVSRSAARILNGDTNE